MLWMKVLDLISLAPHFRRAVCIIVTLDARGSGGGRHRSGARALAVARRAPARRSEQHALHCRRTPRFPKGVLQTRRKHTCGTE
eukprot:342260-Rhodomonas_salina.1